MNLLPEQCRAARGLLDWTQERLANLAGVSRSTVRDFEAGRHGLHRSTETLLIKTFEDAGVRLAYGRQKLGIWLSRRSPSGPGEPRR